MRMLCDRIAPFCASGHRSRQGGLRIIDEELDPYGRSADRIRAVGSMLRRRLSEEELSPVDRETSNYGAACINTPAFDRAEGDLVEVDRPRAVRYRQHRGNT